MFAYNLRVLVEKGRRDEARKDFLRAFEGKKKNEAGWFGWEDVSRGLGKLEHAELWFDLKNASDARRTPLTSCCRIQNCG